MFEHLKDNPKPSWRERLRYLAAATVTVGAVFVLSLWLIAKTANFVQSLRGEAPIAVTYDANDDGKIFNEIVPDSSTEPSPSKESATESPQP